MAEFVFIIVIVLVVINIVVIVNIVTFIVTFAIAIIVPQYCPVNPFFIRISIVAIVVVSLHQKQIVILPNEIRLLFLLFWFRISKLIIIVQL